MLTKQDFEQLEKRFVTREEFRNSMSEITEFLVDFRKDFEEFREEIKEEFKSVRKEMFEMRRDLKKDIAELRMETTEILGGHESRIGTLEEKKYS